MKFLCSNLGSTSLLIDSYLTPGILALISPFFKVLLTHSILPVFSALFRVLFTAYRLHNNGNKHVSTQERL